MAGIRFWITLLGVVQGIFHCGAGAIDASDKERSPRKCWVFNHMNKSGGETVRLMLRKFWGWKHPRETWSIYDTREWLLGGTFAEKFLRSNHTFITGGYTEGLRLRGDQHCKWFTVFRHPISRVVSAYFFCQKAPHRSDQLCGTDVVDARTLDLLTFAEHWGNYGVRQFLLALIRPEDVLASGVGSDISVCSDQGGAARGNNPCPGWYRLKLLVERQSTCTGLEVLHEGGEYACESPSESLKESWMMKFLEPIADILTTKYTAVGILEEWETTLLLFNSTLGIPGFDWPETFDREGQQNAYHAQKQSGGSLNEDPKVKMLREAWVDPELRKILWLDILLYDHALQVFNQQVEIHGLH